MISITEKTEKLSRLKEKYKLGGGQKAVEKVHAKGKKTARERIEQFIDPGSFREFNLWAQPTKTGFDIDKRDSPGDAVVTGYGKVDGRFVCVYAHDFTVLGGTQASVQYWKTCKVIDNAVKLGIPYIGLVDSGGVRIYDAFGVNAGVGISGNADVWGSPAAASGIVPSISLTLGASYAGTAYAPFLADVFFMVKKPYCYMSLASPELLKAVTFKDVTREEIGAPELHAEVTGSCDYLGDTEEDVLKKGRELLSFLPSNCREKPPVIETGDDPLRMESALVDIVAGAADNSYDMHDVIEKVVDNRHFLELKSEYAKNMIVGFARIGGRSVGVIANNPLHLNGLIDQKAVEKEARFIRYCDCFNIPLVFLVDTPGFITDSKLESEGFARHAAMATYAICEATVPKITIHVGKCYNNGHYAMGSREMDIDAVIAWTTADIRQVDFKYTVEEIFNKPIEDIAPEEVDSFYAGYFDSPKRQGALLICEDIIHPKDTRPVLADFLKLTENKKVQMPDKKHGNMPI